MKLNTLHATVLDRLSNRKVILQISGVLCALSFMLTVIKGASVLDRFIDAVISFAIFFLGYLAQMPIILQRKIGIAPKGFLLFFATAFLYLAFAGTITNAALYAKSAFSSNPYESSYNPIPFFLGVLHGLAEGITKIKTEDR